MKEIDEKMVWKKMELVEKWGIGEKGKKKRKEIII